MPTITQQDVINEFENIRPIALIKAIAAGTQRAMTMGNFDVPGLAAPAIWMYFVAEARFISLHWQPDGAGEHEEILLEVVEEKNQNDL